MKKLMFLLAAASLSSVAFAQQKSNSQNVLVGESVDVMEVPVDKYKVETNHFFDNWFFSVGGGAQVLFGDQSDLGKFKKRIAPALQISIGKWFTPGLGLRLQYSGLQSKSFSSEPSAYSKPHMLSEGYYQDKFNYMNLHGDILFNVSNMIAGYNEDRIYDFVPFVGFGFAHSYDAPRRNSLAFNFGIINTFHPPVPGLESNFTEWVQKTNLMEKPPVKALILWQVLQWVSLINFHKEDSNLLRM